MRVGIIGCGLIGSKRAESLAGSDDRLVAVFDVVSERGRALAAKSGAESCGSAEEVISKSDVVVIATPNDQLVPMATLAVRARKPALVEKPGGRRASELEPLATAARDRGVVVKV